MTSAEWEEIRCKELTILESVVHLNPEKLKGLWYFMHGSGMVWNTPVPEDLWYEGGKTQ